MDHAVMKPIFSRKTWSAWAILGAGLLASVFASFQVKQGIEQEAVKQFAFACDQVTLKIQDRLAAYALILRGGSALFAASPAVNRQAWLAYVERLHAEGSVPGVQGIGFAQVIAPDQLAAHIARIRSEGFPEYAVRPPGERTLYTSIIYLEPFRDRNLRAFGFDMFSEPVRRAAMEQARDSGEAALSGKVELVQETGTDVQAGTLMYVPVYCNGAPVGTVEQRRAALIGWAYSPYRMADLMGGILADWNTGEGKTIDLHIYDGPEASAAKRLFDSKPPSSSGIRSLLHTQRAINFNGGQWLLVFEGVEAAAGIHYTTAWATLIGGFALSGLLFSLMLSVTNTRANAARIADELTEEIRGREKLLKESETRFRTMADSAPVLIWVAGADKLCNYFNKVWLEFTGRNIEQEMGNGWAEGVHPEDLPRCLETYVAAFDARQKFTMEYRLRHFDGEYRWLVDNGVPRYDDQDTFMGYIGSCIDITERMQVEQRLGRLLAEQKALLENELIGIVTVKDRTIVWANPAFEQMLGYDPGKLAGTATRNNYPSEEAWLAFGAAAYPVLTAGHIFRSQFEHVRKNGSHIWLDVSGALLDRETGEALWAFTDISDHVKTVEELKRSNTELEQFSYSISHDMRQPLRMISSYLQLLRMGLGDQLDEEKRDYLNFALDGAKRMDAMMLALLDYSRVGRKGEPPAWVESRKILDEALLFLQPAIAEAQADIRIQGDWPHIHVRPDEMLRLVQNLIGNALKFRVAGRKPEITVTSSVVSRGTGAAPVLPGHWRLCVADNGIGIIPGQIGRLFQVFQRLQSRATYEGTGIGLALCRKIAEHHGGQIWAESAGEDQGSRFCLELPITAEVGGTPAPLPLELQKGSS
jgi:PAS domain S-box-containing protein